MEYDGEGNIKSLSEQITKSKFRGLYNLFDPTIVKSVYTLKPFIVGREHEMRIDLIVKDMYEMEYVGPEIMKNVDVILYINDIDNPLNIKSGQILYFPEIGNLDNFRVSPDEVIDSSMDKSIKVNKLAVPNKSTKKDKARESFKNNNYSLPPVAQPVPREPVRITTNGNFSLGGI